MNKLGKLMEETIFEQELNNKITEYKNYFNLLENNNKNYNVFLVMVSFKHFIQNNLKNLKNLKEEIKIKIFKFEYFFDILFKYLILRQKSINENKKLNIFIQYIKNNQKKLEKLKKIIK